MSPLQSKLWFVAKCLCYLGAILVAVCAVMIGPLKQEPPSLLFDAAMWLVGIGVVVGSIVAMGSMTRRDGD